jgi:hypothetical protein
MINFHMLLAQNVLSIGRFAVRTSTIQALANFFKATQTAKDAAAVAPGMLASEKPDTG